MNIGITCFPKNNKFRFRQLLASLLVDVNLTGFHEDIKNLSDLIKQLLYSFRDENTNTRLNLIVLILKLYYEKKSNFIRWDLCVDISYNEIETFLTVTNYGNEIFFKTKTISSYLISVLLTDIQKFCLSIEELVSYDCLKLYIKTIIVYNYIKLNKQFNSITEYINDMLKNGFKKMKKFNTNDVNVYFISDGMSNTIYENENDFIYRIKYNDFIKKFPEHEYDTLTKNLNLQNKLKDYFKNEYKNNCSNDLKELKKIFSEFKNLYNNTKIIGTKYGKYNAGVTRNIFMSLYNDKPIMFIDDDDFSCSLYKRYKYLNMELKQYTYVPNYEIVDKINKLTGLTLQITDRKTRYEFIDSIYNWILKKYNIKNYNLNNVNKILKKDNILLHQILDNLKIIINEPDLITFAKKNSEKNFKMCFGIQNIVPGNYIILDYCVNAYLSINFLLLEDRFFFQTHNYIESSNLKFIWYWYNPQQSSNRKLFKEYTSLRDMLNIYFNNLFEINNAKNNHQLITSYGENYLNYDNGIKIINENGKEEIIFVAKRMGRQIKKPIMAFVEKNMLNLE